MTSEERRLHYQGIDPYRSPASLEEKLEAAVRSLTAALAHHEDVNTQDRNVLWYVESQLGIKVSECVGDEYRRLPWKVDDEQEA